jgi:hypothetical protein
MARKCCLRFVPERKRRNITPLRNFNKDSLRLSLVFAILLEFSSQPVRLGPNDCVRSWIEIRWPAKYLSCNHVLAQFIVTAFRGFGGDEGQELLQQRSISKRLGSQDPAYLLILLGAARFAVIFLDAGANGRDHEVQRLDILFGHGGRGALARRAISPLVALIRRSRSFHAKNTSFSGRL